MKTKNRNIIKAVVFLLTGVLLGSLLFGGGNDGDEASHDHDETAENQIWTCSMDPQIRQNEPGKCPICGMDLIPLEVSEAGDDPGSYQMSENALRLANVQTMVVGRGDVTQEMRLNGKVQVDERNSYSQSTHIPGRIEQLAVNFTGERVNRGQTLATVYSPELVTAQEELLQAAAIRESQPELFEAAKDKLRNWRIGEAQINEILSGGQSLQRFSITADVSGIVTEKLVDLGDYVERGMPIYEIADLSSVWVLFDLYEGQLGGVREGSTIEYTISSLPGETFEGTISFIDPLLNSQTRVATARVEVDNSDGRFKPEMFASGVVSTNLGETGDQELIIPKSAVLWTGERSIVYVKHEVNGRSAFQLRQITLGTSLGDSYVIRDGLEPGEEIVTNGAFTVDAAVQLSGRQSMMNPDEGNTNTGKDHGRMQQENEDHLKLEIADEAREELEIVTNSYLRLKDALVNDDFSLAKKEAAALFENIENVRPSAFNSDSKIAWDSFQKELRANAGDVAGGESISAVREGFDELSKTMIGLVKSFDLLDETTYVQFCPMANNDRGAEWLSLSSEIANPYYGSAMLRCGEITETLNRR